jgi:hypothetical protein
VDAEYTASYPNLDARACFRRAYEAGNPAELTTVTYGDEGESIRAHFRVLAAGSYEIVGEWTDAPHGGSGTSEGGWSRWRCDHLSFLDEPGQEVDGAPVVNAEGECTLIDDVTR